MSLNLSPCADTDASNHASTILLDPMTFSEATVACAQLNERLLTLDAAPKMSDDLKSLLSFVDFREGLLPGQAFWIGGGGDSKQPHTVQLSAGKLLQLPALANNFIKLPALCSQSAPFRPFSSSDNSSPWHINVSSGAKTFTGFVCTLVYVDKLISDSCCCSSIVFEINFLSGS